jgi:hypothetical protein
LSRIKCFITAAAITVSCLFCGCSDSSSGNEGARKQVASELSEFTENCTEVIEIETKAQGDNALDFVNKPVTRHVAQQIASWTPGYEMPPEPYYEDCSITVKGKDGKAQISGAEAKVKVRGNWTTSYPKKSLRIKFGEKQSVLGLNDGSEMKNWVLNAVYKDGSMLRDRASLAMSREILGADGYYAADSKLVEVKINGEYFGVYLLTEYQQINKNRVNITEAEKDSKDVNIGYLLEMDGNYLNEEVNQYFYVNYNDNAPLKPFDGNDGSGRTMTCLEDYKGIPRSKIGFTIKSDIYCKEQHDFISSFVNNVYNIMYRAAYDNEAWVFNADCSEISKTDEITPREAVERVVDTESLADMYIISEMTCDADIYLSSFYMSVDFGANGNKKLTFQAPWDFDSGLGNKERCADGKGFYAANIVPDVNTYTYETINPWLAVLMYQDWYQDIIREKWTRAYDNGVFDRAVKIVEDDTRDLAEAFDRNYKVWDNINHNEAFAAELSREASACKTQKEHAEFLAKWLRARTDFLNDYWHK